LTFADVFKIEYREYRYQLGVQDGHHTEIYGFFPIRNQSTLPVDGFRSPRSGIEKKFTVPYLW
jgi:hypothetical protein